MYVNLFKFLYSYKKAQQYKAQNNIFPRHIGHLNCVWYLSTVKKSYGCLIQNCKRLVTPVLLLSP
jgi:hypothetical protein